MPFVNKSPLNWPVNSASSIRIFKLNRAPTSNDYKNFIVGDEWNDTSSSDFYKLVAKSLMSGTWRLMSGTAAAIETITGDDGIIVPPDLNNNINLTNVSTGYEFKGNMGASNVSLNLISQQQNVVYVAKSGNDANDGLSIEKAKLTFASAITVATAISPATIVCFDAGTYVETLVLTANISIIAEAATLSGSIDCADSSIVNFSCLLVATGVNGVIKSVGAGKAIVSIDRVICSGTGNAFAPDSGDMHIHFKYIEVDQGDAIGTFGLNASNIFFDGDHIKTLNASSNAVVTETGVFTGGYVSSITGPGIGIDAKGTCKVNANDIASGNIGVKVRAGSTVEVFCNDITSAIAILMLGASLLDITVCRINASATAYDVSATGVLNIYCSSMTGAETIAAGGKVDGKKGSGVITNSSFNVVNPETSTNLLKVSDIGATTFNNAFTFPVADGASGQVLQTDGAGTVSWKTEHSSGEMVQQVYNSTSASTPYSTQMPMDNTIPQITEGDEILTATITPESATNFLLFDVTVQVAPLTGTVATCLALFQDATPDALSGTACGWTSLSSVSTIMTFKHRMVAGTSAATTFSVRIGPAVAASTGKINYQNSVAPPSNLFGGVSTANITVTEIQV